MKQIFRTLCCVSLLAGGASFVSADDQTWTGQISDSLCGATHDKMINDKYKELRTTSGAPAHDCTLTCVKAGGKYVFVVKGKVYRITNQNLAALQARAGENVLLTGSMRGNAITVSSIALPPKNQQ